ncbi:MAG: hypothetical protein H6884_03070 [Rhodobiaceae bacterium]|nr:hypothetical protein [Rhodobiaceae bacterium]MCC0041733.1 hypothetical protein [Rhodobiaceae bacterium]MCC0053018.1 hypothetical protein [Rhodobiaceae bacterium]
MQDNVKTLRNLALGAVAAAMVAGNAIPASAEVGSDAERSDLFPLVLVHAGIASPANCAHITGRQNGAPAGQGVHRDAKPVTIKVAMSGGQCGKKALRYTFQTPVSGGKTMLQLFFVSNAGKLLKRELIAISGY